MILIMIALWLRADKEKIAAPSAGVRVGGGNSADKFVIYWSPDCKYCVKALALLQKQNTIHAAVVIDDFPALLKKMRGKIPESHKTKPIIFLNGKFLGGYTDLAKYFGVPAV